MLVLSSIFKEKRAACVALWHLALLTIQLARVLVDTKPYIQPYIDAGTAWPLMRMFRLRYGIYMYIICKCSMYMNCTHVQYVW